MAIAPLSDERAAKSVIQFLRNAERVEEATTYLKYIKDEEWKKREIQTVTTRMLAQYGIQEVTQKTLNPWSRLS